MIGIGGSRFTPLLPSHTTGRTGPYPAVRLVEVVPECPCPFAAVRASPLRFAFGVHPYPPAGAPLAWTSGAWPLRGSRSCHSPGRSALHPAEPSDVRGASLSASAWLLWPLLTARSASSASPFQASGEISPGKGGWTSPRSRRIYAAFRWSQELRGQWPARPGPQRLVSGSCSSARGLTTRFLQCRPRGQSPCGSCGSLRPGSQRTCTSCPRPCWAHHMKLPAASCGVSCEILGSRSPPSPRLWRVLLALPTPPKQSLRLRRPGIPAASYGVFGEGE